LKFGAGSGIKGGMSRSLRAAGAVLLLVGGALASACGAGETASDGDKGNQECAPVELDGGGGIEAPPDGEAECPPGACNYQTQAGCDANETCRPFFNEDGTDVEPGCQAAGDGERGSDCETDLDCAKGHLCVLDQCRKLCCGGDWTACDEGESCIRQVDMQLPDDSIVHTGAELCFPVGTCDLLDPTACDDEGRDCKLVDPTGNVACVPKSPEGLGELCEGDGPSVCQRGLTCVGRICRRLCVAEACGEPSCPEAEGTCVHFDRDPPGIGECTPGW
jgi:hypothetical protein